MGLQKSDMTGDFHSWSLEAYGFEKQRRADSRAWGSLLLVQCSFQGNTLPFSLMIYVFGSQCFPGRKERHLYLLFGGVGQECRPVVVLTWILTWVCYLLTVTLNQVIFTL